ncbi:MAG: hemolysin family protein [Patescibacteria group bacterium]|nr:MAG: hemolysin family protein [Patescibacteria group bacterium]
MENIIILTFAIVIGSAFFSGLEAALFSVPLSRARVLKEQKRRGAGTLVKIKEEMGRAIVVIVIFNNIINIVGSIFVGVLAAKTLGGIWIGIISAILTFLIITIGEIIPKTIGEKYAEHISLVFARPLLFTTTLLLPVIRIMEIITSRFGTAKKIVSEEELRMLSHIGHLEGEIEKDERDMIQKVFTLNDIPAKEIMTPRTVVAALPMGKRLGELADEIYDLRNSRLPVYSEDLDDIVGVCNRVDLLIALGKDQADAKVSDFMQPAIIVSKSAKADDLLSLFKKKRYHLAVVKDEFGGTSGVVTLEDVLEQLVGEIVDETDKYVDMRKKASEESLHSQDEPEV